MRRGIIAIALQRQLGVPPNLYDADLYYLMRNSDIRINERCNVLEMKVATL